MELFLSGDQEFWSSWGGGSPWACPCSHNCHTEPNSLFQTFTNRLLVCHGCDSPTLLHKFNCLQPCLGMHCHKRIKVRTRKEFLLTLKEKCKTPHTQFPPVTKHSPPSPHSEPGFLSPSVYISIHVVCVGVCVCVCVCVCKLSFVHGAPLSRKACTKLRRVALHSYLVLFWFRS